VGKLAPLSELAARHGYKDGPSLRRFLTRHGVQAAGRAPGRGGESIYDEDVVAQAKKYAPGKGARTDLRRTVEHSYYTMHRAVFTATDDKEQHYDVDAITAVLVERYGLVDIDSIDHDEFWSVVMDHSTD